MTVVQLSRSAHFAATAPAIVDFATTFEEEVLSRIERPRRVLHVALGDTRECRELSNATRDALAGHLVLAHDPPHVLGLDQWRPRSFRPSYVRWYARAATERRQAFRDLRSTTSELLTTSKAAADRFGMGYVAPIGPMFTNEPSSRPTRVGVLGHLSPARKQSDVMTQLMHENFHCDMVGRAEDASYVARLRAAAPARTRVLANLPNNDLADVRSQWAVMVMPPSRAGVWSASAAVVDTLCSGVPIAYPKGSAVLSEYIGAAGLAYDNVSQLGATVAKILRDQRAYQATALEQAKTRLAWSTILKSWQEYNNAMA